jgi:hypothetical protein
MKTFEQWYTDLASDEIWFEQATLNHKTETVMATARQIWVNGLSDAENFRVIPFKEHRRHLFNKLCKITPDKVRKPWYLPKEEPKIEPLNPPLTGEARAQRLKEWMAVVEQAPILKAVAPVSSREIIENGDWRPKPIEIREPTEMEKRTAYLAHVEMVRRCRVKTFRDAYPDAMDDEVQAYLDKFKSVDDPLNLF